MRRRASLLFCDSEALSPRFAGSPAGDQPAALLVAGSAERVIGGSGIPLHRERRSRRPRDERRRPVRLLEPHRTHRPSSGDQIRHWLSRAGNRQINRALHIMATVQLRTRPIGRAYFARNKASGKTSNEAIRALKRRLSDIVYRHVVYNAIAHTVTGRGGHRGTPTNSSVTSSHQHASSSEKSLSGPATAQPKTVVIAAS